MDDIASKFLEYGLLGCCVLVLAFVVYKLYRDSNRTQEKRVSEAQSVTTQLLALSKSWIEAIEAQTAMIEQYNANVTTLRDECRERTAAVAALIRDMINELRVYVHDAHERRSRPHE